MILNPLISLRFRTLGLLLNGVIDRALSTSFIASLDKREQNEVASQLVKLVSEMPDQFDYPYNSESWVWMLKA